MLDRMGELRNKFHLNLFTPTFLLHYLYLSNTLEIDYLLPQKSNQLGIVQQVV